MWGLFVTRGVCECAGDVVLTSKREQTLTGPAQVRCGDGNWVDVTLRQRLAANVDSNVVVVSMGLFRKLQLSKSCREIEIRKRGFAARKEIEEKNEVGSVAEALVGELGVYIKPVARDMERLLGFGILRGCILHGESGVGKSLLVDCMLERMKLTKFVVHIRASDLYRAEKSEGETEVVKRLMQLKHCEKAVVILDHVDSLGKFGSLIGICMDNLVKAKANVCFIALTRQLEHVHRELLHPKRLGSLVLHMQGPRGKQERKDLLEKLERRAGNVEINPKVLEELSQRTHGFLPAQLLAILQEWHEGKAKDLTEIIRKHSVSSLKEGGQLFQVQERQTTKVGGLKHAQAILETFLFAPLRDPERLERMGIRNTSNFSRNVLFYGPPGNGKTLLAKDLAMRMDQEGLANIVSVQCPALISKIVGESEAAIISMFKRVHRASPCVLILDQIEAIAPKRGHDATSEQSMDRMLSCLLVEMDGIISKFRSKSEPVIIVGTTNKLESLDPSILRRFQLKIHIDKPTTKEDKLDLLNIIFENTAFESPALKSQVLDHLASKDYPSASAVVNHAQQLILAALHRDINLPHLGLQDFL